MAKPGAKLALCDIDAGALESARTELSPVTPTQSYVLDVRDRAAFEQVADATEGALGPVSLLFNNAGIASGVPVRKMTFEMWDWVLGVNLFGVVNGIQTFVPRFFFIVSGCNVFYTSSGAGLVASGDAGFLYTTSKFAVVGMSEALRIELEPLGIGVSVLCPGAVDTGIVANTVSQSPGESKKVHPRMAEALASRQAFLKAGTSVDTVGRMVVDAIDANQLYIHTDTDLREAITSRTNAILEALPEDAAPVVEQV